MAEGADVELREVEAGDFTRLCDLFAACFATSVGPEYFEWKYRQNPAGEAIGFVADAGDRLAGFYGVIPEPWAVGSTEATVFQSMDTMTHPEFQRRGLFARLAELTYEEVRRRTGACDLVGIAGPASLPGFTRRLGWSAIHEFDLLTLPSLLVRSMPRRRSPGLTIEAVDQPDERIHAVLRDAEQPVGKATPNLTGQFFDWRVFGLSPKRLRVALAMRGDRPLAVCVFGLTSSRTTLVSYVATVGDEPDKGWFHELIRFVARDGVVLYTWRPQNPTLSALYRSVGFRSNPLIRGSLRNRLPLIVRSDSERVNGMTWTDPNSFDLQPLMQD